MLIRLRLPKTLVWVLHLLIIFLLMFTFFRVVTFLAFKPEHSQLKGHLAAFGLGLRYDLRWISFILLPVVLASFFPRFSPFYSEKNKKVWTWYFAMITFVIFFFFAADFGCFSYNNTRLNASALNFAEDPGISAVMLWQSYPIVWMLLALVLSVLLLRQTFKKLHGNVVSKTEGKNIPYRRKWFIAAALLLGVMAYGGPPQQPLKWRSAFRYNDGFKSYLALNPLQNFFATLQFRKPQLNVAEAQNYFPQTAALMNLPQTNFPFKRMVYPLQPVIAKNANVVLVLCESFSMYKSSLSGNILNTTPYLKKLSDSSIFFSRCFTPHFSTARGLFATLTGIPDVQLSKFSSRNPLASNQHTIINNFEGYNKFYFLGGSASFNNFEGLVNNIKEVRQVTEGQFQSAPVNVWGISDKDLFAEANRVFAKQQQPFLAIVQTADNHRPFTIPGTDSEFVKKSVDPKTLEQWGFESVEEYNAFRYFDFAVQHFMEAAKKEAYFNNTIFVFIGDHGVAGNATAVYPEVWTTQRITEEHVPLLFYAPRLLKPQQRCETVSQIDVLPTLAGLTGQTYLNTTLGRDVLNANKVPHFAFTIAHDEGKIGMITDDFYFTKNLNFNNEAIHFFAANNNYNPRQIDSIKLKMSAATTAFYETARYMLVHNRQP